MKFIIVPFTDLLDYLQSNMDLWPLGYNLSPVESERLAQLNKAASNLCQNLILQSVKHIRNKPDPLINLLGDLGYPLSRLSAEELDQLTVEADERYLDLTLKFDLTDSEIQPYLEGKIFDMAVSDEDILIEIRGDIQTERYHNLLRQLKRCQPPKTVQEIDDLTPMTEYIERTVAEVFKNVQSQAVRDELKLIFDQAIKRQ